MSERNQAISLLLLGAIAFVSMIAAIVLAVRGMEPASILAIASTAVGAIAGGMRLGSSPPKP